MKEIQKAQGVGGGAGADASGAGVGGGGQLGAPVQMGVQKMGDSFLEDRAKSSAVRRFVTPNEVRDMASYLGVDPLHEFNLLHIAYAAVLAPLPGNWLEFEARPGRQSKTSTCSLQRALLTLRVNPGSRYRCGKST